MGSILAEKRNPVKTYCFIFTGLAQQNNRSLTLITRVRDLLSGSSGSIEGPNGTARLGLSYFSDMPSSRSLPFFATAYARLKQLDGLTKASAEKRLKGSPIKSKVDVGAPAKDAKIARR